MDDMYDIGKNSSVVIGGQSSNSNQPPRYFHDDIGKQITSIKLDSKNYLACSQAVMVFLRAKMKQKYLTDDLPDENSPNVETWWSEMSMVMTWLWHSMEPSVASTVQFLDTTKKIWNAIEEMYSQSSNVSRIYQIFETMFLLSRVTNH
ncbi:hypothetical protein IFM89_000988 [Coptis chinensis]|uniref:UBN2_3 domain-containing protein n=1 Tax=Coptis chinensis TaxID=261450 RepID=A0A835M3K1_9MAGN|nr:hypothetical protein IFM89_000988 [Coptis chinensis]